MQYPRMSCGLLFALALTGCEGTIGEQVPGGDPDQMMIPGGQGGAGGRSGPGPAAKLTFAPPMVRRLTAQQYQNSLRDLLGTRITQGAVEPDLTDEERFSFGSVGAGSVTTSPRGVEQYDASARQMARQIFIDTTGRRTFVGCDPTVAANDPCVRQFLTTFGRRAWRRNLTTEELTRYQTAIAMPIPGGDVWTALEMLTAALLASPNFLYRAELGDSSMSDGTRRPLTDFEVATRLSYLLWNSTPDTALLDAAARSDLSTPAGLKTQTDRLLASSRARATVQAFFGEWLGVTGLDGLSKDKVVYPRFSSTLGSAMQGEVERVVLDLVFDRDADFLQEFFEGRDTFVNAPLASLYGLPAGTAPPPPAGSTTSPFVKATLPADGPRAGFVTTGAFLASNARATMTSPTLRGLFVRERFLCQVVPPPPPDVETTLPPPLAGKVETTRQRLDRHRTDPVCAGCHGLMDPLGLPLEQFDGIGSYRTRESNQVIDVSGALEDRKFEGAKQLGSALRAYERTGACIARQLYRQAVGRIEDGEGEGGVEPMAGQWKTSGYRFKTLLSSLVASDGFRFVGEVK